MIYRIVVMMLVQNILMLKHQTKESQMMIFLEREESKIRILTNIASRQKILDSLLFLQIKHSNFAQRSVKA